MAKSGKVPPVGCLSCPDEDGGKNIIRKICIFNNETQLFSTLCTGDFPVFTLRCPSSCPINDLFCHWEDDVSTWPQIFSFSLHSKPLILILEGGQNLDSLNIFS